jgi:hypothetical protein
MLQLIEWAKNHAGKKIPHFVSLLGFYCSKAGTALYEYVQVGRKEGFKQGVYNVAALFYLVRRGQLIPWKDLLVDAFK